MAPRDQAAEDLRDMKGISNFSSLSISDSPESTGSQGKHIFDTSEFPTNQSPNGVPLPVDDPLLYEAHSDIDWGFRHDRFMGQ